MPDIFDEFMDDLRRRQAGQPGGSPGPRRVGGDDEQPGDQEPGREGPRRPTPPRRPAPAGDGPSLRPWLIVVGLLALFFLLTIGVDLWTNVLWFGSVGFSDVLFTRLGAGTGLFFGGLLLALGVLLINLWLARRLAPGGAGGTGSSVVRDWFGRLAEAQRAASQGPYGSTRPFRVVNEPAPELELPDLGPLGTAAVVAVALLAAIGVGGSLASHWESILLWVHRVPFGTDPASPMVDPVFSRDISWFLFELPFLRLLQGTANGLIIASLLVALGGYLVAATRDRDVLATPVRVHVGALAGLFLLSTAFGYQLDKYELVYAANGVATGVSYTDANARFFAYDLLTVLSGLAAAFMVGAAFTRWVWPLGATLVIWFLASFFVGTLYPEAVQRFTVEPNKFAQEERFIGNNITMTRLAYGIDKWEERPYSGTAVLTQAAIDKEAATFQNARLWDYRPLGNTLDQLQTVRTYYDFTDVDTDRYRINGAERQVMLSARELLVGNTGGGWVNQRITYTHGMGVAMVPVNEVTAEGQPQLLIKNLPPVSSGGAPEIKESRIYFGEATSNWVIVGARQAEFDYPRGSDATGSGSDAAVENRWSGTSGISLATTLNRLLFAIHFGDLNLLISDQVTNDSQLLMRRSLGGRLAQIAPFLRYDKDPYIVVDERGHLMYVQDAYTISDRFPHAQSSQGAQGGGLAGEAFNYIRNSVKVTMDAYDGTMSFYVSDPSDPVIRAYQGVFPTLFRPISEMPPGLTSHLRVPEELFNVQTGIYGRYHVTQPRTFFEGSDLWTVPTSTSQQSLPNEAYYVVMRMPGEANPEFLLLQPMVATGRPNMISWVAARNDQPGYGGVRVYRFPSDTTIFGPAQIEARIDQDPVISAQVSLWDQAGSNVIRGNLIVVPIGDSLIYLQPVYLQSTGSKFPEFQRIVVASPTSVVWGRTLSEALNLLLSGGGGGVTPTPTPGPGASPRPSPTPGPSATPATGLPSDVAALIAYANDHFDSAQQALRNGDFARYGQEIELVRQALQRLESLTVGPAPSVVASPSAASPSPSRAP